MSELNGRSLEDATNLALFLQLEVLTIPSSVRELFEDIDALTREFFFYSFVEVRKRYESPNDFINWGQGISGQEPISSYLFTFNPAIIVSKLSKDNLKRLRSRFDGNRQMQNGAAWLDLRKEFSVPALPLSEQVGARLADDPNILFYLSVAKPALRLLLQFMDLHAGSPLLKTKEFELKKGNTPFPQYDSRRSDTAWFVRTWQLYSDLGIDQLGFFSEVSSASDFLSLSRLERHALAEAFLDIVEDGVARGQIVQRLRAMQVQSALNTYYRLQDKSRTPIPRKRFLNQSTQMVLSGYFEGSWLLFLNYIHEEPAENDYLSSAVPKPKVLVPLKIDLESGEIPTAEVGRILDSLDPSGRGLRAHISLARDFWNTLINIHSIQQPGMKNLWGLVEDYSFPSYQDLEEREDGIRTQGLFRDRLSKDLLTRIDELFGRQTSPQYPSACASALLPYATFCAHLNPALSFWHGVGLTIWFITQGPSARTDIPGMRDYYRVQIKSLADFGCPVDDALFDDLLKVQITSPPSFEIRTRERTWKREGGMSFHVLNEIFLRHMRNWTEQYFEPFWQERYKRRVAECGQRYNQIRETTGSEPPLARFVNQEVATAANEYFGGNALSLLEALGEPLPKKVTIRDNHLIISVDQLRTALIEFANSQLPKVHKQLRVREVFVNSALRYCIMWEARGSRPPPSAFKSDFYFQELLKALQFEPVENPTKAWDEYSRLVERAAMPGLADKPPN